MIAGQHFLAHLNFKPLICLLCSNSFKDYDDLMKHFALKHVHEKVCSNGECENLLFYTSHNEALEGWVDDHIKFQESGGMKAMARSVNNVFCPACDGLSSSLNGTSVMKVSPDERSIHDHIYRHLNYKPLSCLICLKNGKASRFSSMATSAAEHIASHGYNFSDHNLLKIFFAVQPIEELEKFIGEYLLNNFYPLACSKSIQPKAQIVQPISANIEPMAQTNPPPSKTQAKSQTIHPSSKSQAKTQTVHSTSKTPKLQKSTLSKASSTTTKSTPIPRKTASKTTNSTVKRIRSSSKKPLMQKSS